MMKKYLVGGAVRDMLMGREPKDKDYVVIGSTPQEMLDAGFTQVGSAFPVFLHPVTGEEYALARKERKTGPGYNGFEVEFDSSVTLEEDLSRRDLTINSIAYDEDTKEFIDPFNGIGDIRTQTIRHTSDAFAEDPLRVLRVARFLARYDRFIVSQPTFELCQKVVASKEFDEITAERIWVELWKIFEEKWTSNALKFLIDIDALKTDRLRKIFREKRELRDLFDFCMFAEQKMSSIDKLVMFTYIDELDKDTVNELRIPKDVHRKMMFISDVKAEVLCLDTDYAFVDRIISSYRELYRNEGIEPVAHFISVVYPEKKQAVLAIKAAFDAVLGYNFTELTKGMKASDIKEAVTKKRIELIQAAMLSQTK